MRRLKSREQFQAVLAGRVASKTPHFVLHHLCLDTQPIQDAVCLFPYRGVYVGAMTPKRWAKNAVTRNAIKRQMYPMLNSLQAVPSNSAFLVRLRKQFSRSDFISATSTVLKKAVKRELDSLMGDYLTRKQFASRPNAARTSGQQTDVL